MVLFIDAVFLKEGGWAHLFGVDYNIIWVVNSGYFPLASQDSYSWQNPN
jgi:hypothetical protein